MTLVLLQEETVESGIVMYEWFLFSMGNEYTVL